MEKQPPPPLYYSSPVVFLRRDHPSWRGLEATKRRRDEREMRNDLHRGWHEATTVMERSLSSVFAGESEREDPFFLFSCLTITTTARREPANKLALWLCWLATKQGGGGSLAACLPPTTMDNHTGRRRRPWWWSWWWWMMIDASRRRLWRLRRWLPTPFKSAAERRSDAGVRARGHPHRPPRLFHCFSLSPTPPFASLSPSLSVVCVLSVATRWVTRRAGDR